MKKPVVFTNGNIIKQLVQFSTPIVLGELLQNLYNSVDALFVGNYIGKLALASISVCASISLLLVGFFNGMSAGVISIVAREIGKGGANNIAKTERTIFTVAVLIGGFLSVVGIMFAPNLLRLAGADGALFNQALIYLRIYLVGLLFTVIYNMLSGILRGRGDSRTPLNILAISSVLNVLLDWLFLSILDLGVAGVALATVISQCISVLLAYKVLRNLSSGFRIDLNELTASGETVKDLFRIGIPSGIQNSLISISNLFVWRYINRIGIVEAAGIGVANKLDKFVALPCKSFGLTMTAFISQNAGARQYRRNQEGFAKCLGLSVVVTMILGSIVYVTAPQLVSLFNAEPDVINVGVNMMRTIIPFYFLIGLRECMIGLMRGYGETRIPMVLSLTGMVVIRQIFLALTMMNAPKIEYVYWCFPVAWGGTVLLLACYLRFGWKRYHMTRDCIS